jgi:hypothetical protein
MEAGRWGVENISRYWIVNKTRTTIASPNCLFPLIRKTLVVPYGKKA